MNLFTLYNQGLNRFTSNFCSWYNIFHVIQIQWGLKFSNDYIIKAAKEAEKEWVYSVTTGALFNSMYNFFVQEIKAKVNVDVNVVTKSVQSDSFETLLKEWYAFWIWLRFAWMWWRGARKDQKVMIEEAMASTQNLSQYGHALTYFYSKVTKKYYILDSLKTSRKPVEMSLEALRAANNNSIFFTNARTLVLEDQRLDYYLKLFRDGWKVEMESLSTSDLKAAEKALQLRTMKY